MWAVRLICDETTAVERCYGSDAVGDGGGGPGNAIGPPMQYP